MDTGTIKLYAFVIAVVFIWNSFDEHNNGYTFGYIGADGHEIRLKNNASAVNPTYAEAYSFIAKDPTDQLMYNPDYCTCGDYAELVHNKAEQAGLSCGWVAIQFTEGEPEHACNVFNTTDKGLMYFDCTESDTEVSFDSGTRYRPVAMHSSEISVVPKYVSMGTVRSYQIYWWTVK